MSKQVQIVVFGKLPEDLMARLAEVGAVSSLDKKEGLVEADIIAAACAADIILTEPYVQITPAVLAACPNLRMIAQRAVGYDNINLDDCLHRPILVTNTPGVLDNATADLAFALLLTAGRRIVEADKYVRDGHWRGFENDLLLGCELAGRTIGIVGMGRIGSAMARRARGFSMDIVYCRAADVKDDANDETIAASAGVDEKDRKWKQELGARRVSLKTLLQHSDFISLHCPHNKDTEKLIGAPQFALMKKNCIFVNTARGKVVDEDALCRALEKGQIRGAGLDVFYNEPVVSETLLKASNVVLAPHIGSASEETRYAMAALAVNSVLKALAGTLPDNALNKDVFDQWRKNQPEIDKTRQGAVQS
ncbi:MAG: D-glycerate dehydrogenase [Cyanobacteria bacterium REEB67]|nr:D-glycerate dehydrogenase [Cyanobacteria bacterium REEB67]